jgi:hypothetical protein
MTNGLTQLSIELDMEPLFHASLGSKELFHSNLLAWMAKRYPELARQVWQPWLRRASTPTVHRVRREFGHMDLVIELDGYEPLVVENKTFSMPDFAQLQRYAEGPVRRVDGNPRLVLLSLIDPGWRDDVLPVGDREWRWVSYRQLGEQIHRALDHPSGAFADQILVHESRLMVLLDQLIRSGGVRDPHEPLVLGSDVTEPLARVGIADALGKARAYQIMAAIRARLDEDGVPETAWPLEAGFSRAQPLLSAFWRKGPRLFVGWQYQARQWRLAMIVKDRELVGRTQQHRDARAEYARSYRNFFDFTPMYDVLGCTEQNCLPPRSRTGPDDFNRYDPDFVY